METQVTILAVDDVPANTTLLKRQLEAAGYKVVVAADGVEALEKASADKPDIIISDILMPGMDGFQLCRKLKESSELRDIPLMFLTASYTDAEDVRLALSLGASRVVTKPIDSDALVQIVKDVLEQPEGVSAPPKAPPLEEPVFYRQYSERLVKKLEAKMIELEAEVVQRKQVEEALRESGELYRTAVEALAEGFVIFDSEATILEVNYEGARILGSTRSELLGRRATSGEIGLTWLTAEGEPADFSTLPTVRAFQTGRQSRDELMGIRRRDGSVVHVRSNATPIVSAGSDTPDRIVVTYVDITEQFAAERRAAEAAADMSSVFEVTADALVMADESGTILRVNSATYDMFRYEEGELLGQNVSVLSPDPTRGEHARYLRHYLESGQASTEVGLVIGHSREMVGRRKDGSEFPVEFRVDEIRRDDGSRAFSAQIRDITERRQAERDRAQAQRSAVRADFLSTMSHELRTPLNSILGFGQLLEMQFAGPLNEKQLGQVQDIVGAGEQLLALINDLLDIWRIDAQRWAIEPAPLHPGAVIAETTRGFGDAAAAKGIDLRAVLNDAPAEATLDERALRQVVSNLVENAVKFTDDGRVEVRAIEQDGDLVVTVADSGCGIAEEDRERIFDEFTQVQSGLTREHEGTGLGLAIVRRLVEAHGGGVSVESALGEGSTFTVRLPLKPPAADARPAQAEVVAER